MWRQSRNVQTLNWHEQQPLPRSQSCKAVTSQRHSGKCMQHNLSGHTHRSQRSVRRNFKHVMLSPFRCPGSAELLSLKSPWSPPSSAGRCPSVCQWPAAPGSCLCRRTEHQSPPSSSSYQRIHPLDRRHHRISVCCCQGRRRSPVFLQSWTCWRSWEDPEGVAAPAAAAAQRVVCKCLSYARLLSCCQLVWCQGAGAFSEWVEGVRGEELRRRWWWWCCEENHSL